MAAEHCMPTADISQNCCMGSGEGAACSRDWDCLGLMTCNEGRCGGASGCDSFCERLFEGRKVNCCVPESLNLHRCAKDADCLGARPCDLGAGGICTGDSGCDTGPVKHAGLKVVYDLECLCLGITNTCLFPDGVPCSQHCRYTREETAASCLLPTGSQALG
jgi:hypothetical protein